MFDFKMCLFSFFLEVVLKYKAVTKCKVGQNKKGIEFGMFQKIFKEIKDFKISLQAQANLFSGECYQKPFTTIVT